MFRCCLDLVKFILFIVNFAAFVVVSLVLAGAIYTLLEPYKVLGFHVPHNLENPTIWFILLISAVSLFGFLVLFTFLGCCGAACKNRCMLGSFIIILMVFLGANIAGIVYVYVAFPNTGEIGALSKGAQLSMPFYDPADSKRSVSTMVWDFVQQEAKCCGADTIYDWTTFNDNLKGGRKVPGSCCDGFPDAAQVSQCVLSPSIDNGAYTKGCVKTIGLQFKVLFWGIPALMALMLIFALIVCSKSGRDDYDRVRDHRRTGRRSRDDRYRGDEAGHQEDTPWEYQYPTAPPYNGGGSGGYGGGHRGPTDQYPTGPIPYNNQQQPLIADQPPRYQDVAYSNYRDSGKIQY